jgi:hypothetical protein
MSLTKTQQNTLGKIFLAEDGGENQLTKAKMNRILAVMVRAEKKFRLANPGKATPFDHMEAAASKWLTPIEKKHPKAKKPKAK